MKNSNIILAICAFLILNYPSVIRASSCVYTQDNCFTKCGHLQSYPTYEKESCITACWVDNNQLVKDYNECVDAEREAVAAKAAEDRATAAKAAEEKAKAEAEQEALKETEAEMEKQKAAQEAEQDEAEANEKVKDNTSFWSPKAGSIKGLVTIYKADGTRVKATNTMNLSAWDTIKTSFNSSIVITFNDWSKVQLGPTSQFILVSENAGKKDYVLSYGRLKAQFKKMLKNRITIRTPWAAAAVRGTEFIFTYNEDSKISQLHLYEWILEVTSTLSGETKDFNWGDSVIINENGFKNTVALTESKWTKVMNENSLEKVALSLEIPFQDMTDDNLHMNAIRYLKDQNIVKWNADGTLKPKSALNRAEWATILVRLSGASPSLDESILKSL